MAVVAALEMAENSSKEEVQLQGRKDAQRGEMLAASRTKATAIIELAAALREDLTG